MKKILSMTLVAVMAMSMMCTTAFAMTASNLVPKTTNYYTNYREETFYNVVDTEITRTMQPDGTFTVHGTYNVIGDNYSEHPFETNKGAYFEVDNIVREYNDILYSYGPVHVTLYGGEYCYSNCRGVGKLGEFDCLYSDGTVIGRPYIDSSNADRINYMLSQRTDLFVSDPSCGNDVTPVKEYYTITEPGYYCVSMSTVSPEFGSKGYIVRYIYVAKPGEDISKDPSVTATANPQYTNVKVNDVASYNCPTYDIEGMTFAKVRDIAYMLRNTDKHFNVVMQKQWRAGDGKHVQTASAVRLVNVFHPYGETNVYTPNGTEMSKLGSKSVTATLNTVRVLGEDGNIINPVVYKIAGSNYMKIKDIAAFYDFGYGYDSASNTISLNTAATYYSR